MFYKLFGSLHGKHHFTLLIYVSITWTSKSWLTTRSTYGYLCSIPLCNCIIGIINLWIFTCDWVYTSKQTNSFSMVRYNATLMHFITTRYVFSRIASIDCDPNRIITMASVLFVDQRRILKDILTYFWRLFETLWLLFSIDWSKFQTSLN